MSYALLSLLLSVSAFAGPVEKNNRRFSGDERRLAEARRAVAGRGDSVFDGQTRRSPAARTPVGVGRHGGSLFAGRRDGGALTPPAEPESGGGATPPSDKVPSPGNGVFAAKDGGGGVGGAALGVLKNPMVATGLGLLLGAAIGFMVAGPLGAFVGAAIGGAIGWRLS